VAFITKQPLEETLPESARLALLDWDGTFREGWTLLDWVPFLVRHRVLEPSTHQRLNAIFDSYLEGQIDHDELAASAGEVYALGVAGASAGAISSLVSAYLEEDRRHLYRFVPDLCKLLRVHGLELAVITGAPMAVVSAYTAELGISHCHGLELSVAEGHFTGAIVLNPGLSTVKRELIASFGERGAVIVFAIGDSTSDTPLFQAATAGVIVGNKLAVVPRRLQIRIAPHEEATSTLEQISSLLDQVDRLASQKK